MELSYISILKKLLQKRLMSEGRTPAVATPDNSTLENYVDINQPVTNPRLLELLQLWHVHGGDNQLNLVLEEIALRAHFLSVVVFSEMPESNGDGTAVFKKNSTIQIHTLTTQDNKIYYPCFTDWNELSKSKPVYQSPTILVMSFDDYYSLIQRDSNLDGIVINPFGDNLLLNRKMIDHMKTQKDFVIRGVSQHVMQKDTKIMLGEPKDYPFAMINSICESLKDQPGVRSAWLRLANQNGAFSYLVVVDFDGNISDVFGAIAAAARPHLNGINLDMIPYQDNFGKNATDKIDPFYTRK